MTEVQCLVWLLCSGKLQELTEVSYTTSDLHKDVPKARQERDMVDTLNVLEYLTPRIPFGGNSILHSVASGFTADATVNCDYAQHVGKKVLEGMIGKTTAQHTFKEKDHVCFSATATQSMLETTSFKKKRRTFTNYKKADWTQFSEDTESAFAQTTIPTNIHTVNRIFTNIILMADKQNIPKGKMHSNCRLLPEDIVCKITQRNNIRRANTCDPALKLLNEEITSDIQKHKQNIWKEHLDAHWDHRHNTHTLWKTIHGISNAHTKRIHNIRQQNSNYTQTTLRIVSTNNLQTLSNTQHTKQADTLTEQHTICKDAASHSLLVRSKRL